MSETSQTTKAERKKTTLHVGGKGGKGVCVLHDQAHQSAFAFKFFFKQVVGHNGAEYKSQLLPVSWYILNRTLASERLAVFTQNVPSPIV